MVPARRRTTTIEAKSGYGLTLEDELKMLRAIKRLNQETALTYVPTFLGAHDVPAGIQTALSRLLWNCSSTKCCRVSPRKSLPNIATYFAKRPSLRQTIRGVFCRPLDCHGFWLAHARRFNWAFLAAPKLAGELGSVTADHLEHTDDEGIAALKAANIQPVLLPGSVYALGSIQLPAAREMIDAGLAVCSPLTLTPVLRPTPSMPMILSLAARTMKMTPAEAVTAATINCRTIR